MQIDNIIKEIRRIQDFYHMSDTMAPHEMERWLIDLSYDLLEYKQEVEDEMMYLRDEARDYEAFCEDEKLRADDLERQIEWIKSMSAYGFSDWKQGKTSWD